VPRGRPLKSIDPTVSAAARLGAELRGIRVARNLTLHALSARVGFAPQHISEVELGKATASEAFVAAADRALGAEGHLFGAVSGGAD
jgi:transcriptional regulator with XRE-family HTH domain